jgi:Polyketide cyclase / dehydrase and lipid transport
MWAAEHSVQTTASPESIWRLWSDVSTWGDWNADIERIEISGPFATGSTIAMTPVGQDTVELRITKASKPNRFVDEADLGEVLVTTFHRIEPLDNERSLVTYRMEITGPAADTVGPELGPEISGDFPETLAALVERAAASEKGSTR